ncbi:MAG: alpha/beta fold hydrolase [Meiothermus sp.]|nr:alpha/beta fold hydrolase [Meiothermus sp.]
MKTQHGFAEVNGTRLYYESAGEGTPVVLVHGFTLDTRMWDDQFLPLTHHFRAIRYDMRGFGQSGLPSEPYSHADDLKALMEHLEVEQAHLIGLSKGGAVVLDFALTHPNCALSLTLIDGGLNGLKWSPEGSARFALVWQRAREGGIPAAKESWLAHPFFVPAHRQPGVVARLEQIVSDYSGWHFLNKNPERGLEPPAAERLAELKMPLLLMVGEHDTPDLLQAGEFIAQQVPQARHLLLRGVGHMANMEAPELVNAALLEFLGHQ